MQALTTSSFTQSVIARMILNLLESSDTITVLQRLRNLIGVAVLLVFIA